MPVLVARRVALGYGIICGRNFAADKIIKWRYLDIPDMRYFKERQMWYCTVDYTGKKYGMFLYDGTAADKVRFMHSIHSTMHATVHSRVRLQRPLLCPAVPSLLPRMIQVVFAHEIVESALPTRNSG